MKELRYRDATPEQQERQMDYFCGAHTLPLYDRQLRGRKCNNLVQPFCDACGLVIERKDLKLNKYCPRCGCSWARIPLLCALHESKRIDLLDALLVKHLTRPLLDEVAAKRLKKQHKDDRFWAEPELRSPPRPSNPLKGQPRPRYLRTYNEKGLTPELRRQVLEKLDRLSLLDLLRLRHSGNKTAVSTESRKRTTDLRLLDLLHCGNKELEIAAEAHIRWLQRLEPEREPEPAKPDPQRSSATKEGMKESPAWKKAVEDGRVGRPRKKNK